MSTWSASLDTGTLMMDASTDADKQAWRSLLSHLHPATISLHADEALRLLRADVHTRTATHADATLAALVDGSAKCGLVSSMLLRVYDRASALGDARWLGDAFARACAGTLQPLAGGAANVPPGHARAAAALWGALVRGGVVTNAGVPDALAYAGDFERLASTRTEDAVLSAGLARTLRYGGDITVEVWPEQRDAAAAAAAASDGLTIEEKLGMSLDEIKAALNEASRSARALPDDVEQRVGMTLADLIRLDPTTRMRRRRGRAERRARRRGAPANGGGGGDDAEMDEVEDDEVFEGAGDWAVGASVPIDEDRKHEFKAGVPRDAEIERQLVAFANERGGRLYLGVTDEGHVKGLRLDRGDRDALRLRIDGIVKRTQSEKADSTLASVVRMRFEPKAVETQDGVVRCVAIVTVKEGCRRVIATADGKIYRRLSGSVQDLTGNLQAADELRRLRSRQRKQDHIRLRIAAGASLSSPSESYSSSLSPSPARSSASKRSLDDSDASTQGSEDGRARQLARTGGADSSSESDTDDDGAGQMRQMRLFTGLAPVEEGEEGAVGVQL